MAARGFGEMQLLLWAPVVCLTLLVGSATARAEVIVDDQFDGDSLDANLWGSGPLKAEVSGGRLIVSAFDGIQIVAGLGEDTDYMYTTACFYDIRVESIEDKFFQFRFGCGYSDLAGWAQLMVRGSELHVLHRHEDHQYGADLGPWVNGDYAIEWTPSVLNIYRSQGLIYTEEDPERLPYYVPDSWGYSLGFTMWVQDGTVSIDRVVVLTPEPGTLTLIVAGSVLCLRRRKRR